MYRLQTSTDFQKQINNPIPSALMGDNSQSYAFDRSQVYRNEGNPLLLSLISREAETILDVGCGAGDNVRIMQTMFGKLKPKVVGITSSSEEAAIAQRFMTEVHIADLDISDLTFLGKKKFDVVIFSHVLEHLKNPIDVIFRVVRYLKEGGQVLIAVPNVLEYKNRARLLGGHFEYEDSGIMDRTHLRFFTWYTADRYLITPIKELQLVHKVAEGGAPLWILRRFVFPVGLSRCIDRALVNLFPNLFAGQVVMAARYVSTGRNS
jgi:2-polyprenyl-3-methyl-5-hydroxy-6-metoxy-1,4-benzoquinol methylase